MIEIPVPPFQTIDDAKLFQRLLLIYLRELKQQGEPVDLPLYLLATALSQHSPSAPGACASCGQPYPCRTLLTVAVVAQFPVEWTPEELFAVLVDAGLLRSWSRGGKKGLGWGNDPLFGAVRVRAGGWKVTRSERGKDTASRLPDDSAMVDYLSEHVRGFPFPFAWQVKPEWIETVQPGVAMARHWWAEHARLPYLENERPAGAP